MLNSQLIIYSKLYCQYVLKSDKKLESVGFVVNFLTVLAAVVPLNL